MQMGVFQNTKLIEADLFLIKTLVCLRNSNLCAAIFTDCQILFKKKLVSVNMSKYVKIQNKGHGESNAKRTTGHIGGRHNMKDRW